MSLCGLGSLRRTIPVWQKGRPPSIWEAAFWLGGIENRMDPHAMSGGTLAKVLLWTVSQEGVWV